MPDAAYFNVHGQPLALSARDAVLVREPLAYAEDRSHSLIAARGDGFPLWKVRRASPAGSRLPSNTQLGCGATEEAAWLDALSRMRIADNEEAERG